MTKPDRIKVKPSGKPRVVKQSVLKGDVTERKQVEGALKASEQNFRNSLDSSFIGIRISDNKAITSYVNKALLDIFGYENIDEVRSSPPPEHYTPESRASWVLRHKQLMRGEPMAKQVDIDIIRKDGMIRHLDVSMRDVFWDGRLQYQTFYNDITAIKQAEEIVKNSEQSLHNALDKLPMGFRITDIDDNTLYLNQAFLDIFGYENIEEVIRRTPLRDFYTPESYADYLLRKEKLLRGEPRPDKVEVDIIRKDGALRHLQLSTVELVWNGKQQFQTIYNDITERKQTEEALQLSEQNFRNSLGSSFMGIYIADTDWHILYVNQAFLDIFGYENIEEVRTSPPHQHYTKESYADYLQRNERLARGEPNPDNHEIAIIRKDGTIRHLQIFRKEVLWDGKQLSQLLYNDITERVQAEEALKASEQNFRNSMDTSSMGIRIMGDNDQTIYANQALLDIFGYKNIKELRASPPQEHYTPESHAAFVQRHEKFLRGEPLQERLEFDIIRKDGVIRHLHLSSKEVLWNGKQQFQILYIDITERVRAEEKVEQVAEEWRTTFDSITDMISIHDKDNRIVRANKAMADLLKTTPQQLVGKFCHEVMHGTKEPPANCPHLQTLKTGKSAAMETFNPNFEIYFHEASSPLFNEKGEVTGSVIAARDVTKQKQIEEQLIVTDRLASIGELSSGIAHELNNPLTSVIGFSQLLMEGNVPADIKNDLAIINSEAQRAAVIVKNLLTFARKHAPVTQPSQVNTVIEDVLKLRTYEQKVNNIEVEKHLATDLQEIMMDPFQIQQVFLNIIVNAEFAMLEAHQRGKLVITTERTAGVIRITFTDDGPGITESNQKSIFDPFFTTKAVGKGTGLGLSICHGIVTEHGGKIFARSAKGQGATFVVELPLNGQ